MKPKNDALAWLESLKRRAEELHAEESTIIQRIREGFVDRSIVFIDIVGSTQFKVAHKEKPEVWILRIRQYSSLIEEAIKGCKGTVVKYIGDEVMATFENIYDAQNLICRISEIEANLVKATGYETRIKIAVDYGPVYEIEFDGHDANDPQGTPVDRCARIAKYGQAGEVLSSDSFARETPKLDWKEVGATDLKGLGEQVIYQLGRISVNLEPMVEIKQKDISMLKDENKELNDKCVILIGQNKALEHQLKEAGKQPISEALYGVPEKDVKWLVVLQRVKTLKSLIEEAPGSSGKYARFIFLHYSHSRGSDYDSFKENVFDELIESNHVIGDSSGYFWLNPEHPRNQKVMKEVKGVEKALNDYLLKEDKEPSDLFEWSLKDPEFWNKYIGFNVMYMH